MTTKKHYHIFWAMMLLFLTNACSSDTDAVVEEIVSGKAISFSSGIAEQGQGTTRGTTLGKDFIVYGYKYTDASEAEIFPGCTVEYQDNAYNYIGVNGQTVRYWDVKAKKYRFWATTGNGWIRSGKTFTVENHPLLIGQTGIVATDLSNDANLYASVVQRDWPFDTKTVSLEFNHAYSQVSVYFYYEAMQPGVAKLRIDNVKFTPVATPDKADKIYNKGKIQVQYPADAAAAGQEVISVVGDNTDTRPCLEFAAVTLTGEDGQGVSHAVQAEIPDQVTGDDPQHNKFYYPLPMSDQNPDFVLSMSLSVLDADGTELLTEVRTATIPASYMHWKPNYAYRYFFKISGPSLMLQYDVKIDPWTYGGSQNEKWENW